jgi:peptidoglycan hydrolase-like protein with peptidoglycan-binding domain
MGAAMKANAQAAKEKEYAASADQADADMGAAMTAATQAANGVNAAGQNVTMPDGTNPETGEKTATAAAPAAQQAASPAAPAAAPAKGKSDPNIKALQDKLIAAGAKIKADGIMGPQTRAAMQQFPKAVSGNVPLPQGVAPSTAGGGRGGQGGPTAAQMAARPGANQPAPYNAARDSQAASAAMAPQPGVGQKGPTKAAAAGQDATNPLNKAPAAPSTQSAQSKAVSADYSSANDAGRNPNAGLEPSDPRWRGPKPASETVYREALEKMLMIAGLR